MDPAALGALVDDIVVVEVRKQHIAEVAELVVARVVQRLGPFLMDLLVCTLTEHNTTDIIAVSSKKIAKAPAATSIIHHFHRTAIHWAPA